MSEEQRCLAITSGHRDEEDSAQYYPLFAWWNWGKSGKT